MQFKNDWDYTVPTSVRMSWWVAVFYVSWIHLAHGEGRSHHGWQCIFDRRHFHGHFRCWKSSLQWRHNECGSVSNYRRLDCLLNRLCRRRSQKTPKLRVTGLCEGNSPVADEFPSQRASNAENVPIWWLHHVCALNSALLAINNLMNILGVLKDTKCYVGFLNAYHWK